MFQVILIFLILSTTTFDSKSNVWFMITTGTQMYQMIHLSVQMTSFFWPQGQTKGYTCFYMRLHVFVE